MDCVRVSLRELEGEKYAGNYVEMNSLQNSGVDACRQLCVSSRDCVAWECTPDQKCFTTASLKGSYPVVISAPSGTRSGLVECKDDWSMLKLIWWVTILGLVLVVIWYVMTKCVPRAKAQGQHFFPRFYFTT